MLTNHNTELINELYGNKGYRIDVVSVKRMINSDASNRVGEEVIICNYSWPSDHAEVCGKRSRDNGELIYKKSAIILRDRRITIDTR